MKPIVTAATLREVAAACGLSISTVSRALRTPEMLNKDTLRLVTETIAALDYRPSLIAQTLRGERARLVLVVMPSLRPFFLDIFRGAERAAAAAGYGVLVGNTDRDPARERRLLELAAAGSVDGVILVTSVDLAAVTTDFARTPIVVALDVPRGTELPTVRVDHVAAARDATRYLVELGHREIAHVAGPPISGMSTHRLAGYREALEEAGLPFRADLCVEGAFTVESGRAAVERLLRGPRRPTAIFAASDQMAIGAAQALRGAGLRIPEDVALIGFDDERLAALYDPPLSTVRMPTLELGKCAMEQMLRLLDGAIEQREVVLETELAIRKSTAPGPAAVAGAA